MYHKVFDYVTTRLNVTNNKVSDMFGRQKSLRLSHISKEF